VSSPNHSRGVRLAVFLAFFAVAVFALIVTFERSRYRRATERLARERGELQVQLDSRDLTITQLRAEIRNLRSLVGAPATLRTVRRDSPPASDDTALRRQIAELQTSHSNTLVLAGSLLADKSNAEEAEEARKATEAVVAELESATAEAAQNAELARQKAEDLLTALNVPSNVEALDTETALASPNLRVYWSYFEARREHDLLERVAEALRLRLAQESASAADAAPPGDSP